MEKKELSRRRRKAEKGGLRGRSREGREREKKDKNTISKRTRIENVKAKRSLKYKQVENKREKKRKLQGQHPNNGSSRERAKKTEKEISQKSRK